MHRGCREQSMVVTAILSEPSGCFLMRWESLGCHSIAVPARPLIRASMGIGLVFILWEQITNHMGFIGP